jgi:hypothetical protein
MRAVQKEVDEYLQLLGTLPATFRTRGKDWRKLFPHLPGIRMEKILKARDVACPPILVQNAVNVLRAKRSPSKDTVTVEFYGSSKIDPEVNLCAYANEALEFSKTRWGSHLIENNWQYLIKIILQNPRDLSVADQVVFSATNRSLRSGFNDIGDDNSAPQSVLLQKALVFVTSNSILGKELRAASRYDAFSTHAACALCGWWLSGGACPGCETEFKHPQVDYGYVGNCCGPDGAMALKIAAAFRKAGHVFSIPPESMYAREKKEWDSFLNQRNTQKSCSCV